MNITIHRASSRGHANHGWLDTYHTFSFANYFNPERMQFGALRVLNDDKVLPEEGFGTHPHKNMEVVSIPLKGRLRHGDSLNNSHTITRGKIQVMSAGTGILHSKFNDSPTEPLEFLQIWIIPDRVNAPPRYRVSTHVLRAYMRVSSTHWSFRLRPVCRRLPASPIRSVRMVSTFI